MQPIMFSPHPRYLWKQWIGILLGLPFQILFFSLMFGGKGISSIIPILIMGFSLSSTAITLLFAFLKYRNLRYTITEDEVIVASGIFNKTIRHVPFRTVTNMQVIRGFWDRLFGLGILEIQTAGTGTAQAEERLVGLEDVQGVYEYVAGELRRFRGVLTSAQSNAEGYNVQQTQTERELLVLILKELKGIRKELSQIPRFDMGIADFPGEDE